MATLKSLFTLMALVAICGAAPKKPTLKLPEECKGKGFCPIKPEGYDEIQESIKELLGSHFIPQYVGDRIGDEDEISLEEISPQSDWHNCPYVKTQMPMYAYSHANDTELSEVIIQNEYLQQPVDSVSCGNHLIEAKSETEQCFGDLHLKSLGLKSKCETSYTTRNLYVYNLNIQKIVLKPYLVACCCTCKINNSM